MQTRINLSRKELQLIKSFLIDELSPTLIYLFGSFAKGVERPDSDIDIAFLSKKNLDEYKVFLLAQKLADQLNREVDLVDINKASTVLKAQIIQGQLIYNDDNLKKMNFELETLKKYAKLNEERKVIIDKLQRGVSSD